MKAYILQEQYFRITGKCIIKILMVILFCLPILHANTQNAILVYEESDEDIVNPERGFYIPTGTRASKFVHLDAATLKQYRTRSQQVGKSSYKVKVSLVYRGYELDTFKSQPLSASFLRDIQKDFDAIREAGLKVILRFAYTNKANTGNCPDEYKICPPYGDAPKNIVLNHIRQLEPVLRENADVIAVLQQGFIGIWGENYFTDYFGDASTNGVGKLLDSSWLDRAEVLKALLNALPGTRMVQVRTPQMKQKFVGGPAASVNSMPMNVSSAFDESDQARIGFHNDCFLASADDYGTFHDYGSSTQPRQPANEVLRKYIEADTRYTVVGGETCDDAFSPNNDCAPAGYAEEEMRRMHYSYLNASYNTDVNNDWDSLGCMASIKKNLGYRLLLIKSEIPAIVKKGNRFALSFSIQNNGYATMYNPRPVILVFRNVASGKEFSTRLTSNTQLWYPGIHAVNEDIILPAGISAGDYQLYLHLPDASASLAKRPEYSVQLCNKNVWEETTGYNSLLHTIKIR
jgi:hypothetical protein